MFQSLRPNSQIYVFYKGDNPRIEKGYVVSQPIARQKYQIPSGIHTNEMVVDIVAKINGATVNYNCLPANLDIADTVSNGECIVLADNKDAMNAEIISLKQKSIDIIDSIDFHKKLITSCDNILADLNPEFAEKKAQQDEINTLRTQMLDMSSKMDALMETNRSLIERLNQKN